tara:strand:+ start:504 stop:1580 length:1077 start_codon:yes stop_codon:yes gene_type:complete
MIKVLFDSSIFLHQKVGGVSKYITQLNENLPKFKISSKILSPITINDYLDNKKKNINYFLKFAKIPRFCRKIFFFINNLSTFVYIKFYKPDILHFSYYNKSLIKFLNIPYVLTVYDLIHEQMKLNQKQFEKKALLKNARHIICISKETKKNLMKIYKVNKEKISVIYLGTQNTKYKKFKKKNRYILFVGNRTRYKNFNNLIKAFSESKYLIKNYKIICYGGGEFLKNEFLNFKNLNILKNIKYEKGNDEKLLKYYKRASLYVSLSNYEGFGLTLLEAMKMKCPVVCSDIPVFHEVYGNSCKYVNAKNIDSIRKGIESILKSKLEQKRLISRTNLILKQYTWSNCALKTSKIYKKILSQ